MPTRGEISRPFILVHYVELMRGLARFLIPLLALPLLALDAPAQENTRTRHRDTWALAAPAAPSPREAATRLLARDSKMLAAGDALELAEPTERTSLTASHFHFPQTIGGVPVLNGGVAISIRPDGTASLHDRTGRPSFGVPHVSESEATLAAIAEARKVGATEVEGVELVAWVGDDGVARAHQRVVMYAGLRRWAVFVDAETGAVAWTEPLFMTAQGQVFDPNPVTTLNDPTLLDGDDSDASVPQGAYTSTELPGLGSSGPLASPHVAIVDIELPATSRADQSGELSFTRRRDEFEEVNAWFHIDRSQRYLQSLGFTGSRAIVGYAIEVDPHAGGGNDDSSYRFTTPGRGRLFFGDGGVDDAEDADILLHEYAHAIQDSIVPSGFTGPSSSEPRALGEGFSDYWAFSAPWQSSRASGRDPFCVGDWDARCAPGPSTQCGYDPGADCLRRVDGTKTMADYLRGGSFGTEHINGEIWSSALREVFVKAVARLGDDEGRRTVDRTILESHFGMPPSPSFRTAALRMIDADRRLNRGLLTPAICAAMSARGIVDVSDCDLGLRGDLTLVESPARDIAIPDNDPNGVTATLRVSDTRVAEEIYVRVNIEHPRRGDLRLTLTAPDGASIVLQVENGDSAAGIKAVYGLDAEPSQPLSPLAGKSAAGTWTLRVTDTFGVDDGRLVSWGMMFRFAGDAPMTTRGAAGLRSKFIPVAGSVSGAYGTRFVSDARIANVGTATERVTIFYTPSGSDGTTTFSAVNVEIPPGEAVALDDFVRSLFHESGTGAVEIRGDEASDSLVVTSRVYNDAEHGTYGQFVRTALRAINNGPGEELHVLHLSNGAETRSNLGIAERGGGSGTVEIRLLDAAGALLGVQTVSVQPFGHLQLSLLGGAAGVHSDAFRAELRVTTGSAIVAAYGSAVDNISGDAIFVPAWSFNRKTLPPLGESFIVPAVIRADGANGTHWRSDLRVMNRSVPGRVAITYNPASGELPRTAVIELKHGETAVIDDVLKASFGVDEGRGSLRIVFLDGIDTLQELVVTSRTWTPGIAGTFGQFIPALPKTSEALSLGMGASSLIHIDSNAEFRCNIGLTEVEGHAAKVRIRLVDASGAARFISEVAVPSHGNTQFNLAAAGAPEVSNGRLTFEVIEGAGGVIPYASVIDNATGDPIFVSW